jgi:hypothetical protein
MEGTYTVISQQLKSHYLWFSQQKLIVAVTKLIGCYFEQNLQSRQDLKVSWLA